MRAFDLAAREMGTSQFGLEIADDHGWSEFGAMGQLLLRSASLFDSMRTLCNVVGNYNTAARYWLEDSSNHLWLCRAQPPGMDDIMAAMELYTIRELIRLVQIAVGNHWKPEHVRLCAPRSKDIERAALFAEARIFFGAKYTSFSIAKDIATTTLNNIHTKKPIGRLSKFATEQLDNSLAGNIRLIVLGSLAGSPPNLDELAEIFGTSRSSIQRALKAEGLSYSGIIAREGYYKAVSLLETDDMPVGEIGYELGYADPAKFVRAFRHWAGVTPGVYRKLHPQ